MRYPQWSNSFVGGVGFAQVQAVNGVEVQKELETFEAYYSDERRGQVGKGGPCGWA